MFCIKLPLLLLNLLIATAELRIAQMCSLLDAVDWVTLTGCDQTCDQSVAGCLYCTMQVPTTECV